MGVVICQWFHPLLGSGMPKRSARQGPGAPLLQANVAELRALAHPLRLRILELFAETPRTTKQVADLLGAPPTRLYHHVAALERAGLLELRETRKNRGAVEKWYGTPARTMGATRAMGAKKRPAETRARRAVAMTVLEQSRQEVLAALVRPEDGAPTLARLVMAAPHDVLPKVRNKLLAFLKEIQTEYGCDIDAPPADDTERWTMTLTFAPTSAPVNDL